MIMEQRMNFPIVNRTDGHMDLFYYSNIGMYRLTLCEPAYKSKAAWLSTLVIDEEHRNVGHGNELLAHAEEEARKWKCSALSLEVEWKSWVRDWYERKGFVVVAEGIDDSMVVMTKIL
jgi:GNAT superfamily N-acetyltransferase